MAHINWDFVFYIDPATLQPGPSGVPVPTYGNYGGAGYAEGTFGPPVAPYVQPKDELDRAFKRHDIASAEADTVAEQSEADIQLIRKLMRQDDATQDAEASLYSGIAALGMIGNLAVHGDLDLLPERRVERVAAEAVDDILQGASALSFPETLQALQWLGEVDDALAAAGLDLGGLLAATGLDQYLPDGWPL
jgi:hypothetical protein